MPGGILLALAAAGATNCHAAAHDLAAGVVISADDLAPAPCRAAAPRALLYYDRAGGVLVTRSAVRAGDYLGPIASLPGPAIAKGSALTLRSTVGPVVIERAVVAMQPGRAGGRVFVRDSEGKVFAVPLAVTR